MPCVDIVSFTRFTFTPAIESNSVSVSRDEFEYLVGNLNYYRKAFCGVVEYFQKYTKKKSKLNS